MAEQIRTNNVSSSTMDAARIFSKTLISVFPFDSSNTAGYGQSVFRLPHPTFLDDGFADTCIHNNRWRIPAAFQTEIPAWSNTLHRINPGKLYPKA